MRPGGARAAAALLAAGLLLAARGGGETAAGSARAALGAESSPSGSRAERSGAAPARSADAADEHPAGATAALRAGVEALRARELAAAIERLDEVARSHPLVADHAERLAIEARLEAGDVRAALAAAARFAERHRDSPLRPRVARLRGDAAARLGDAPGARSAWREALAELADPAERAALQLAVAGSLEAAGDAAGARAPYVEAWIGAPGSAEASDAERALERLEARAAAPRRSAHEWERRAEALLAAGAHASALDAYERALARAEEPPARARIARGRAHALFRARRYGEARAAFAELGDDPEARLFAARALARSGDTEGAAAALEEQGREAGPFAWRARLLAATLLEDAPATREHAASHYAAVAQGADGAALRADARWRLGWLRYRDGRFAEAEAQLSALAAAQSDPIERLRARYWAARAKERAGGRAQAELDALAGEAPLSYYGWLASLRSAAPTRAPARPADPDALLLPGSALARLAVLIGAGLAPEVGAEIDALATGALGDADRIALASLASEAGDARRASAIATLGRAEALARGPAPGREALWRHAWPRAFEREVEAAARAEGAPRELLFAVMREESAFDPRAVSAAGARGLLQLMPDHAARLAREAGLPAPAPDALFDPALNVRLGARNLALLLRRLGRRSAALAGYNAGAAAASRWLSAAGGIADDEWVEAIPYDETRGYVRRVLRSLRAYQVLY